MFRSLYQLIHQIFQLKFNLVSFQKYSQVISIVFIVKDCLNNFIN